MTVWGFFVVGLLVPLLLNEVSDLGSWIAGRLLSWGARRLGSPEKAARYSEEWAADLERVPGKLTKVGYALGVVAWGVPRMRLQFALQRRRQRKLPDISNSVSHAPVAIASWERLHGSERHAACLTAARQGDRQAWPVLVEDLTPLVWHVARTNGLDRFLSEDAVQSVWLSLLEQIDTPADPRDLAGWLITETRAVARQLGSDIEDESA
jgi:hypothetical protein